jgi:acyl-CoA thioesterase
MRPGWAKVQVKLTDPLRNPNGQIHGGVIASLIDMSITQAMLLTDSYQQVRETRGVMTTVDLRVKYLRALSEGVATVETEIIHSGRRIVHSSSVVTDQDGRKLALGDSTLMIVLGKNKPKSKDS